MTENSKSFIDSNIWIYALLESQDKQKASLSKELLNDIKPWICLSTQVINEVCAILRKKAGIDELTTRQLIVRFYFDYEIVDIDQAIIVKGSEIREKYPFSFWDGIIAASALAANAGILYSEDMQDGFILDKRLKIVNPFNK
jgi:predicted nucleic acid-binding protein